MKPPRKKQQTSNDNIEKVVSFFAERYPDAVLGKSRKREIVQIRRTIVNFLYQENKMRVTKICHVIGKGHTVPLYFLRQIKDRQYEAVYRQETEKFRKEYFKLFPANFHEPKTSKSR